VRMERVYIRMVKDSPDQATIVTMVQSAESLARKDATRSCGTSSAVRCSLPESEMRAVVMVITDGCLRFKTASCCRSTRFSSKRMRCVQKRNHLPFRGYRSCYRLNPAGNLIHGKLILGEPQSQIGNSLFIVCNTIPVPSFRAK